MSAPKKLHTALDDYWDAVIALDKLKNAKERDINKIADAAQRTSGLGNKFEEMLHRLS